MSPVFFRSDTYVAILLVLFTLVFSLFPVFLETGILPMCRTGRMLRWRWRPPHVPSLYRTMQLEGIVGWDAFRQAVTGYHKIAGRKRDVLTLIDFSRPSTEKRLFVFDMKQHRLLFSSVVSHGKNSGGVYATSFSNEYGSYKSSLGFYLTEIHLSGKKRLLPHPQRAGEGHQRPRPRTCHCDAWSCLCRPFGCGQRRTSGTQLRLSGCSAETHPPHHRRHQGRKRDVYLCRNSRLSGAQFRTFRISGIKLLL